MPATCVTILQRYSPGGRSLSNSLVISPPVRKYAKNPRPGLRVSMVPQKTDTTARTTSTVNTLVAFAVKKKDKQTEERKFARDVDVENNENQ